MKEAGGDVSAVTAAVRNIIGKSSRKSVTARNDQSKYVRTAGENFNRNGATSHDAFVVIRVGLNGGKNITKPILKKRQENANVYAVGVNSKVIGGTEGNTAVGTVT